MHREPFVYEIEGSIPAGGGERVLGLSDQINVQLADNDQKLSD